MVIKDVAVIGGGVVGNAILHALAKYRLQTVLIEKQNDVCEGASKANSGIVCTGFDSKPGSVETKCILRSQELWPELVEQLKIPYLRCGAVMVARNEEDKKAIFETYMPNAEANRVEVYWVEKEEVLEANPALADTILGGLMVPGEGVIDPFWATRAFGELAVLNGAEIKLGNGVQAISEQEHYYEITLENNEVIRAKYIVNAAGLWADEIARMVGDDSFTLTPRKGQFLLTEELVPISHIILPVPNKISKGMLVTPVVFGGFLIGPTAEDQEEKWDRSVTEQGMNNIIAGTEQMVPAVKEYSTIRQFAGVRAVTSEGDFIIRPASTSQRFVHAAGIRSTGISAAPGIGQAVLEQLRTAGLDLQSRNDYVEEIPELFSSEGEDSPGEIVCLCRNISRGEIVNALHRPFVSPALDGIKRRTGAMLGECQGNYCCTSIIQLMEQHQPNTLHNHPVKGLQGSHIGYREVK